MDKQYLVLVTLVDSETRADIPAGTVRAFEPEVAETLLRYKVIEPVKPVKDGKNGTDK